MPCHKRYVSVIVFTAMSTGGSGGGIAARFAFIRFQNEITFRARLMAPDQTKQAENGSPSESSDSSTSRLAVSPVARRGGGMSYVFVERPPRLCPHMNHA